MQTQDLTITAGDSKTISVTVKDEVGDPVNLTGGAVKWQCARNVTDQTALIQKSTATAGITITSETEGAFEISILGSDTIALGGKNYYHEAKVILSDGTVATVVRGTLKIEYSLIDQA